MPVRLLVAMLLAGGLVSGQSTSGPEPETDASIGIEEETGLIITTETNLVVVPLHVYRKKKSIDGLGAEAFELLENGTAQKIAFVEGPGMDPESSRQVPIELVFLIDVSHSVMRRKLLDISTIRNGILKEVRDNVKVSIYGFAGTLKRFTSPTNNPEKLEYALEKLYASEAGQSKVFEAIAGTARAVSLREGSASRMMIVFSDGLSTTGFDPNLAARVANHYGIPLYPVVLGHQQTVRRNSRNIPGGGSLSRRRPIHRPPRQQRTARTSERERKQELFADLGAKTGGQSFDLKMPSSAAIGSILKALAQLANTEYIVGYYPQSMGEEPTPRQVEVRLRDKKIGKLYGGKRVIVH